jgi:hypothetical protein
MEPKLIPSSARARDFTEGKRFLVNSLGGGLPSSYVLAGSATEAETYFRRLHGYHPGGIYERMVFNVIELED